MENSNDVKCSECQKEFEFLQKPIYKCRCNYTICNSCAKNTRCPNCEVEMSIIYPYGYYFFKLQRERFRNRIEEMKFLKEELIEESEGKNSDIIELIDKILNEPKSTDEISNVIKGIKERADDFKNKRLKFIPKADPKPLKRNDSGPIGSSFGPFGTPASGTSMFGTPTSGGSIFGTSTFGTHAPEASALGTSDFGTTNDANIFIKQIYEKIKSGEKLLTFHRMKNDSDEVKFGKISYWSNTLYFHSLDLKDPEDCTEFIRFQDLKTILSNPVMNPKKNFRLFSKICSNNIDYVISIRVVESIRTPHVVNLFTGECGSSYKGAAAVLNSKNFFFKPVIECFENPPDSIGNCWDLYDYTIKMAPGNENSFFVILNKYDIFFSNDVSHRSRSVGIAEMSSDLKKVIENNGSKIVDCGFSFTI